MIKSPLNYTGNKYRILEQIKPYFPNKVGTFVDLFCGGATVGINVEAENVLFIDNNPRVIGLLKYLSKCDYQKLLKKIENVVEQYGLSYSAKNSYSYYISESNPKNKNNGLKDYNQKGFYKLRDDYNQLRNKETDKANLLLYVLLIYGFNNDLRFNANGDYNLPCGKTDLNKNNLKKIKDFIEKSKVSKFEFKCADFRDEDLQREIMKSDFLYLDPPYLITDAVYNEGDGWNEKLEIELLSFLTKCKRKNLPFVLSNVLCKDNGKICNEPLKNWIKNNVDVKMVDIDYHYRSSSYNKKNREANEREIIIVFRGKSND